VEYYEQPGTPSGASDGAIWIDTDAVITPGDTSIVKNAPGVAVTHSVDQSIAPATLTLLNFDTVRSDQRQGFTMWQASTPWTLYLCAPGFHYFHFGVRWGPDGSNLGTHRSIEVRRGGPSVTAQPIAREARIPQGAVGSTEPTVLNVSGIVYLDATYQWVQCFVRHDAVANRSVLRVDEYSPIGELLYLGPALLS